MKVVSFVSNLESLMPSKVSPQPMKDFRYCSRESKSKSHQRSRFINPIHSYEPQYSRLKVSCEQTHLHVIQPHQFIDSPEWEANREQSDDVFQVTVIAEEGSTCLCWPRMRLERVLRHRPMLKVVLDSIIGNSLFNYNLSKIFTKNK